MWSMIRWLAVLALACATPLLAQDKAQSAPQDKAAQDHATVLERINWYRKAVGLDPVVADPTLSKGCQLHAEYLAKNEGKREVHEDGAHTEIENLPGFSKEGRAAGPRSLIGYFVTKQRPSVGVDHCIASLYHRLPFFGRYMSRVGIGVGPYSKGGGVVAIDASTWENGLTSKAEVILYPSADQEDIECSLGLGGGEWPNPTGDGRMKAGNPITADFDTATFKPESAEALLEANGTAVEFWLSTPTKGARPDKGQPGVICLIAKDPFKKNTKYTVTVRCKNSLKPTAEPWSKSWSFTTSSK